jgi:hypothetical protein
MFNSISWSHFIFAAIGLVSLYYLVLLVLYLKAKINRPSSTDPAGNNQQKRRFWQMEERSAEQSMHSAGPSAFGGQPQNQDVEDQENEEVVEDKAFDELTQLAGELESFLSRKNEIMTRNAVLHSLGVLLKQHPNLYRMPYRVAIYNLIRKRAKDECNLTITEEELEIAWKG